MNAADDASLISGEITLHFGPVVIGNYAHFDLGITYHDCIYHFQKELFDQSPFIAHRTRPVNHEHQINCTVSLFCNHSRTIVRTNVILYTHTFF